MQERTLGEIAERVGGRVCGDPRIVIRGAATLAEAREGDISFLVNPKYERQLETTKASAVIVAADPGDAAAALLVADDPYYAFMQVMVLLYGYRRHPQTGIGPQACIARTASIGTVCQIHNLATIADHAQIGDGCVIYPGAYIGEGTRLGSDCILYPNVAVYDGCSVGNRVIIHANSTIGADGFGFATHDGVHHKIPQVGGVVIEDDVEIGSCCSIQRGTLSDTRIGRGSKLGDVVTIGHGAQIGPYCLLVAQVGVAGSTTLGHHCVVGGQVGIVGHITIGNNVTIGAQAGVVNSVPDGQTIAGAPAVDAAQARKAYAVIPHLPQMRQDIRSLRRRLQEIAASLKPGADNTTEQKHE